jgi:hypothetical protein
VCAKGTVDLGSTNGNWSESDWDRLVFNVKKGNCTPFLGAGVATPPVPAAKAIAQAWAATYKYPFRDTTNLARVAQFVAVDRGEEHAKMKIQEEILSKIPPSEAEDEPHQALASLNLPLYLTTNYDDFMYRALRRVKPNALREHCPWYKALRWNSTLPRSDHAGPTVDKPIVYHLHGIADEWESMVLTEEDYLNFLIVTSPVESLPPWIAGAFGTKSLLFLGYSLQDIDFLVLFRRFADLMNNGTKKHFAVQIVPGSDGGEGEAEEFERQRQYLEKQLNGRRVTAYWGTCQAFCKELRERCL